MIRNFQGYSQEYTAEIMERQRKLAAEAGSPMPTFDLLIGSRESGAGYLQNWINGVSNRNADVLFRGKRIDDLTREEAIEAVHQAVERIKRGL